jgi:hypothetical protein
MIRSRLPLYLLPLTAPLALLAARGMARHGSGWIPIQRIASITTVTALVLVGLKGGASVLPHPDNMAQLHALLRDFSSGGPPRVASLVGGQKLFGLQYYLDGDLHRLTWTGKEDFADESLGEFLVTAARSDGSRPFTMVTLPSYAEQLPPIFSRYGVSSRKAEGRYWTLIHVFAESSEETIHSREAGS